MQEPTQNFSCCKKCSWIIFGGLAIFGAVYLFALTRNTFKLYDYIGKSDQLPYTIAIAGEGKVTAIPDVATVSLGLETKNLNISKAQQENTDKINKLIDRLKALDIKKEDIKTTSYSVFPDYNWVTGRQILEGYKVSQNVLVKIRNFDKIPEALNLIGELNLNQVGGLNFTIDEPEKYRQEARLLALENAKQKAEALAKAADVKLGKLVSFTESGYQPPIYYRDNAYMLEAKAVGGAAPAPQVEAGSQEVTVNVSVTYEVK